MASRVSALKRLGLQWAAISGPTACSQHSATRTTRAGEVMPQKSTLFAPKLPSGLLFRLLDAPGDA